MKFLRNDQNIQRGVYSKLYSKHNLLKCSSIFTRQNFLVVPYKMTKYWFSMITHRIKSFLKIFSEQLHKT